jgi:signal transduction histidine kinase
MLAFLFLLSIWLDPSHPARMAAQTYGLLLLYMALALALAAVTWRNWWLDARLAIPAHFMDMAVFTGIVFSTNIYTSPFFLFFILPLLAAAIRWGWRATGLTASALILLYLAAGLLVAGAETFQVQRFIIRSGNLLFLSALLIWFGIHQRFAQLFFHVDDTDAGFGRDEEPLGQALRMAMQVAEAPAGALLIRSESPEGCTGPAIIAGEMRFVSLAGPMIGDSTFGQLLFDMGNDRALGERGRGRFRFAHASDTLFVEGLRRLAATEGLVAEVRSGTREGWLVLWGIADLSSDYLAFSRELGRAVGAMLDRDALLSAIEEGAAVRARLSLARDVHDSVVQFLAGAAFRIEAIMRASRSGEAVEPDLAELKRLLVAEQGEIRGFISALRKERELDLAEAVEELRALATRLSQQWSVACRIDSTADGAAIPIRLQLDLQQLLREAVANAVRHGGADRIDVGIGLDDGQLRLEVTDNGSGFPQDSAPVEPWSLKERVDRAHGSLALSSKPGCTNVVIRLPLSGGGA